MLKPGRVPKPVMQSGEGMGESEALRIQEDARLRRESIGVASAGDRSVIILLLQKVLRVPLRSKIALGDHLHRPSVTALCMAPSTPANTLVREA